MAIRIWSDSFSSGIVDIDDYNRNLFGIMNKFEEENGEDTDAKTAAAFLSEILSYCRNHFHIESELMESSGFPLADYHESFHSVYMGRIEELIRLLLEGEEKEPYYKAVEAAIELEHHIVRDDLTVYYHRRHRDAKIGREISGSLCELFSLTSEHLGYGTILSVQDGDIEIECKKKLDGLRHGDVVKVTLFTKSFEFMCFAAKVYGEKGGVLRLFSATVIKTVNDREYFRIPAGICADMWVYGENEGGFDYETLVDDSKPQVGITVVDIGAGGALVETGYRLNAGEKIKIRLSLQGNEFFQRCEVVRALKNEAATRHYGIRFMQGSPAAHKRLVRELLRLQAAHMKEAKMAAEQKRKS